MTKKLSNEAKVGFLLFLTLVLVIFFAWLMGAANPFKRSIDLYVNYNFAGGIEVGSPVRVAGIKVGKVEKIQFWVPNNKSTTTQDGQVQTPLRLKISVAHEASEGVREDSKFYINLAGIIGERYIEITPGSVKAAKLSNGSVVQGIDPPRIDQLISQSFDLAGKVKDILDKNEGDITKSITLLYQLSANINKTLGFVEKSKLFKTDIAKLVENLIAITNDVKVVTAKSQTEDGKKTLELLYKLLWRLEPLDQDAIRKFFQKEGIRAKLF
ncbi:MAG: MlaD family protein [Bacteriovoracia bacterium]